MAAAAVGCAAMAVGSVLAAWVPGSMLFGSMPEPSGEILRVTSQAGFPVILVAGMIPVALAIAADTLQARAAGAFGTAMTVFSLIMAVITLASIEFFPLLAPLVMLKKQQSVPDGAVSSSRRFW